MKRVAMLAATACAMATAAAADAVEKDSNLSAAFRNTIVSTYPDGRQARLWLNPDGTYKAEGRRHDRSSGHWKVKNDRVCLRQSHPLPVPFTYCTPMRSGGVGASWRAKAVTGEPIRVTVVRGRA